MLVGLIGRLMNNEWERTSKKVEMIYFQLTAKNFP
jgi:hypothetical protein